VLVFRHEGDPISFSQPSGLLSARKGRPSP
jgi:hypothetical protein